MTILDLLPSVSSLRAAIATDIAVSDRDEAPTLEQIREDLDRRLLRACLEAHGWNETAAAEYLGLSRRGLQQLREKLGVERPAPAAGVRKFVRRSA